MPKLKEKKLVKKAAKEEVKVEAPVEPVASPEPAVESKPDEETKMIGTRKYRVIRDLKTGTTSLELIG